MTKILSGILQHWWLESNAYVAAKIAGIRYQAHLPGCVQRRRSASREMRRPGLDVTVGN
jgi:hypothetical protein